MCDEQMAIGKTPSNVALCEELWRDVDVDKMLPKGSINEVLKIDVEFDMPLILA